ncbi:MAG TPA: FG-GAP-like repeat-containing protein [Paracoccaceae bacterium]|nr:FG-GAP-like repeat-containing protein [Paracoccaceae bacterium]
MADPTGVARLVAPTDRYGHDVLGGIPRWSALELGDLRADLPETLVFEDVAPRLWDVDGDGRPEVVVVEAHVARGARLAVWDVAGGRLRRVAATPFIGQANRWLAPSGIADFDGDGRIEIAYVDRPHLARELVFVRLAGDRLEEVARAPGLTNHRIGDTFIAGGLRDCGAGPEVVLATPDWTRARIVRLGPGGITPGDGGAVAGPAGLDALRRC